jgi:hypothetical protein
VLLQVQRLPDTSLTVALASGGREHFGWGVDRHMKADIFDALNTNTRATGQWQKGKVPTFPVWPRPTSRPKNGSKAEKNKTSVADLYAKFARR